jgi:hypothetical protein
MKNVLKVTADLTVQGIVNTNGNSPTYYKNVKLEGGKKLNNHVFAKTDREGVDFTSSACLRKAMFNPGKATVEPDKKEEQDLFASSMVGVLRGYMYCSNKTEAVKRKSPVTVLDAYSTEECIIKEVHSHSGERTDISFFSKDNAPKRTQKLEVFIDLDQLKTFYCNISEGISFNATQDGFVKLLNKNLGFGQEVASVVDNNVVLNELGVKKVLTFFFNQLKEVHVKKADAFLEVKEDTIKVEYKRSVYSTEELLNLF